MPWHKLNLIINKTSINWQGGKNVSDLKNFENFNDERRTSFENSFTYAEIKPLSQRRQVRGVF